MRKRIDYDKLKLWSMVVFHEYAKPLVIMEAFKDVVKRPKAYNTEQRILRGIREYLMEKDYKIPFQSCYYKIEEV